MNRLTEKDKENLLEFARNTIAWKLGLAAEEPGMPGEGDHCGAFVTLRKECNLRGCIGNIISDRPLEETIKEMAEAAAFRDPRFIPLTAEELDKITIEISLLSPLVKVDNPAKIKPGRDGLYIRNGLRSGLLLPQVATEQDWDRDTFISQTLNKAGLPLDSLEDENTEIFSFTAEVFGESDT